MSNGLLFGCGAVVFTITVIATFLYAYHSVRRVYATSLLSTGVPPELYVKPAAVDV
jgi:hypothetical protein